MKPRAASRPVLLVSLVAMAVAGALPAGENQDDPGTKDEVQGEKEKPPRAGEPGRPINIEETPRRVNIPEIPRDQLPKRTRTPPDPEKQQYVREAVCVRAVEKARPMKGGEYTPKVAVVQEYLAEYFRRAGFEVVTSPEKAVYRIDVDVLADFHDVLVLREQIVAWKYTGTATLTVLDRQGRELEKVVIPEMPLESAKDEETCVLELRRLVAKQLHDKLFTEGEVFANKEAVRLLAALLVDPLEAKQPMTGGQIISRLADMGLPAVPYLLEALTDTRTVFAETEYPNLTNLEDLKVCHVADKALEEIFQKISRMNLATTAAQRYIIIRGWENEWRRFCRPFRESPQWARRKAAAARRAAKESPEPGKAGPGR